MTEKPLENGASGNVSLSLDKLHRRFGRRVVFSDITATVDQGRTLVVTGPNGSGKSTLLRIVAGLLRPTAGAVRCTIDGQAADPEGLRRSLGYVAPDLYLYSELTGAENLQFFARLRGQTLSREQLISMLERVGLKSRGGDLVGNYSSGMRQRLKYAFALMPQPPILLMDEPTANLDAHGVDMVQSIIED